MLPFLILFLILVPIYYRVLNAIVPRTWSYQRRGGLRFVRVGRVFFSYGVSRA